MLDLPKKVCIIRTHLDSKSNLLHLSRVVSSVGRASALHAECRRFESVTTHQIEN